MKVPQVALHAALALSFAAVALPSAAQKEATTFEPQVGQAGKDVIWVPTPDEVVERMLDMAKVSKGDRVVDLGSGDGKIAIAAARRGATARGIEYNPDMVELSKRNAQKAGVKVDFVQGDIFESDFRDAQVVTLYLLPSLNEKLRPTLLKMKPGTRVTSHSFRMGDWEPDETASVNGRDAFYWKVPANVQGEWNVKVGDTAGPTVRIKQTYQKVEGTALWGNRNGPLRDAKVDGNKVTFSVADPSGAVHRFEGTADHTGPMQGTVTADRSGARPFTATRRG